MAKMKWRSKVFYLAIALALAVSLAGVAAPTPVAAGLGEESEWSDVSTPSEDGSVILPDSDILSFDTGPDGEVIYAVVDSNGGTNGDMLLKSEDSGVTWDDITDELPEAADLKLVSVAPDNADFVVVASDTEVYGSNEGGDDFEDTAFSGGEILCLDVSCEVDDEYNMAVGTDAGEIWRFVYGGPWGGHWEEADYDGWLPSVAVTSVAFSPNFEDDDTILAVTTPYELLFVGDGTAEWTTDKANSGSYSALLSDGGQYDAGPPPAYGMGKVVVPDVNIPLADITTLSYWFNYNADGASAGYEKAFPYITIHCNKAGTGTTADYDISLYDPDPGYQPSENEWVQWTLSPSTKWQDSLDRWVLKTLAENLALFPNAVVLNVAVTLGCWGNVGEPITSYVDDIAVTTAVGTTTYDLEPVFQQSGLWGNTEAWNDEAEDKGPAIPIPTVPAAIPAIGCTGIALPEDYTGYDEDMRYSWVYVNSETAGRVFEIDGSRAEPADVPCGPNDLSKDGHPLLASISMTGEIDDGALMVGAAEGECCEGIQVYRTGEWPIYSCCPDWQRADKPPTGLSNCIVAYTPDGKKAYAATSGDGNSIYDESAFSMSEIEEVGKYWNQLSLIDTYINYLSDVAVNPDCGTIYLASVNTEVGEDCECDSVWASTDEGDSYMRIWCGALEGNDALERENGLLRFNPEETEEVDNVYLVDQGTNVVYWNDNSGFTNWSKRTASTLDEIVDFAVLDESTVYAVDSDGDVARSDDNASRWLSAEGAEVGVGHTIAVLGDYVLVGGEDGEASYSDDEGESFTSLDLGAKEDVHVAFDSYFEDNGVTYAAADDLYVCYDLEEADWDAYGETSNGPYFGIVLDNADGNPMTDADTGGVLYAVSNISGTSGMARLLGAYAWEYDFDYLDNGLDGETFTAEPSALKICDSGNSLLWAINMAADRGDNEHQYDLTDGANNLFVYEDCLAKAGVELSEVKDGSTVAADPCECVNGEFVLKWGDICNSDTYALKVALDEDFDYEVTFSEDLEAEDIEAEYLFIPKETLECSRTYYWKVRVTGADGEGIQSWWSPVWSFTVGAGPGAAIKLTAPEVGASNVPIEGVVFTWTSVAGATSYDFSLMDANGTTVDSKTGLTGTSYAYAGALDNDSPFTWQVTAMKDGTVLSESSVSTFSTVSAAVFTCPQCGLTFATEAALEAHIAEAHAPAAPAGTPVWVWVVISLGAVLVITVIVLIFRTRRV